MSQSASMCSAKLFLFSNEQMHKGPGNKVISLKKTNFGEKSSGIIFDSVTQCFKYKFAPTHFRPIDIISNW